MNLDPTISAALRDHGVSAADLAALTPIGRRWVAAHVADMGRMTEGGPAWLERIGEIVAIVEQDAAEACLDEALMGCG